MTFFPALPPFIDLIVREREKKRNLAIYASSQKQDVQGGKTGGENKCTTSATVEAAVRGEHINRARKRERSGLLGNNEAPVLEKWEGGGEGRTWDAPCSNARIERRRAENSAPPTTTATDRGGAITVRPRLESADVDWAMQQNIRGTKCERDKKHTMEFTQEGAAGGGQVWGGKVFFGTSSFVDPRFVTRGGEGRKVGSVRGLWVPSPTGGKGERRPRREIAIPLSPLFAKSRTSKRGGMANEKGNHVVRHWGILANNSLGFDVSVRQKLQLLL